MKEHRFPYEWTLKDANFTKDKGTVFSCFACGGGSTMGYKLAGFDVLGCNEIDPKMIEAYKANHNPKYAYLEPIQTFKLRKDLPKALYDLDILDGSPPCSNFSMAGNREKDWGKEKKFREGQSKQVLDTLFFDFIDLAKELQPKVVVAENVEGLIQGNAKKYVIKIYEEFEKSGYYCQHWLLNASKMGVPQNRKRVFFICLRKNLAKDFMHFKDMFTQTPKLNLNFKESQIAFGKIRIGKKIKGSESDMNLKLKENGFVKSTKKHKVHNTITGNTRYLDEENILTNSDEIIRIGSFPSDYNFLKNKIQYLIGMSVCPVQMANIASEIYKQWLSKLK